MRFPVLQKFALIFVLLVSAIAFAQNAPPTLGGAGGGVTSSPTPPVPPAPPPPVLPAPPAPPLPPILPCVPCSNYGVFDVTDSYDGLPGAIGDGLADDTAAIKRALAAAQAVNGELRFPLGQFLVSGSGAQIFLIKKIIKIRGIGMYYSEVKNASTVPITTDQFRVALDTDHTGDGFEMTGMYLNGNGAGRHGLHLDARVVNRHISRFNISNNWIGGQTGYSIATTCLPDTANGVFSGDINYNVLGGPATGGALLLTYVGDSIRIRGNTLVGEGYAAQGSWAGGAVSFLFEGNNCTSDKGIHISGPFGAGNFVYNNFEGGVPGSNNAYLDFDGSPTARIIAPIVRGNNFQTSSSTNPETQMDNCRFNWVQAGVFAENYCQVNSPFAGLRITANATGTRLGDGNFVHPNYSGALYINEGDPSLTFAAVLHERPPATGQQGHLSITGDVWLTTQGKGVVLRDTDGAGCHRLRVNSAGTIAAEVVPCP